MAEEGKRQLRHWDVMSWSKEVIVIMEVMGEYGVVRVKVRTGRVVADGFVEHQVLGYVMGTANTLIAGWDPGQGSAEGKGKRSGQR